MVAQWFKAAPRKSANPSARSRSGVLIASGMIVGESLFGVALAAVIVGTGKRSAAGAGGRAISGWRHAIGLAGVRGADRGRFIAGR